MPSISKAQAEHEESAAGFSARFHELDDYTVAFESHTADGDLAALFKGLPGDRCQCPHWGYVLKGKVVFHYADGEDIVTEGHAYYARPGHTPELFKGTEVVEFSPTAALAETMEAVMKNLPAGA
jgi:hypothetical protein